MTIAFTPGETVGSYRIIEQLGRGGQAARAPTVAKPIDDESEQPAAKVKSSKKKFIIGGVVAVLLVFACLFALRMIKNAKQ